MKLTDEERNSLVILQLEKAKVFLKQADEMFLLLERHRELLMNLHRNSERNTRNWC